MKKSIFVLTILLTAACSGPLPQKVDYPHYAFRNANSQELVSVERTDTATILSFKSFFRPNWWILVAPEAYLTDGTARYALKGTEGITPGEHLHMDDNGNAEYNFSSRGIFYAKKNSLIISELTFKWIFCAKKATGDSRYMSRL